MNDSQIPDPLQTFNLETMSGVFPGTRTRWFYLLQITTNQQADGSAIQVESGTLESKWLKVFWLEDPASVVLLDQEGNLFAQIDTPTPRNIFEEITNAAAAQDAQVVSCGSCRHWLADASLTNEQCAYGRCTKRSDEKSMHSRPEAAGISSKELANELSTQSALAPQCPSWRLRSPHISTDDLPTDDLPILPISTNAASMNEDSYTGASTTTNFGSAPLPDVDLSGRDLPTTSDGRGSLLGRLKRWIGIRPKGGDAHKQSPKNHSPLTGTLAELDRSGVGAGTEPCPGCHGRIANLGALVVGTDEGDKQTFSVWRCRNCAAAYLNSWIDRWERLDNLETEEALYRVSPAEALLLLAHILGVDGGDHPKERQARVDERGWIDAFRESRMPISHQVRHGR